MPNRILKDSIRTSRKVNDLSDFNFRIWSYLITYVDDYGRGSADPELLKGLVFPRRKGLTEVQISKALDDLANTGMIKLYEVDGESYLYFPNWDKHQQIRAKKSRFPAPDNSCNQMISDDCTFPRNPIQSNPNPNPNPNPELAPAREAEALGKVMSFFFDKINPTPSQTAIDALRDYTNRLGPDIVLHALGIALDERKTSWSYINAILQRYQKDGLKDMEAVIRSEQIHAQAKAKSKKISGYGAPTGIEPKTDQEKIEATRRMYEKMKGGRE